MPFVGQLHGTWTKILIKKINKIINNNKKRKTKIKN